MIKNIVILVGRLGRSIELKKSQSGTSIVNFALAVDNGKDANGDKITDWIDCKAFGKTAELITTYTHKGDQIMINGRLTVRDWEDRNGLKRKSTEVLINEFSNLSPKKEERKEQESDPVPMTYGGVDLDMLNSFNEDDMPF